MDSLISVIIPIYNRRDLICRAVNSVCGQTYKNWELIIVDDYGNDQIENFIDSIFGEDQRIKVILNERKKGISGARNTGISNAKGKYLAFLDSDDEWLPCHLDKLVYYLELEEIEVGFAFWKEGQEERLMGVDHELNFKKLLEQSVKDLSATETDDYIIYPKTFFGFSLLTYFYCYHINTMIIMRSLLLEIGGFDEKLSACEDNDLLFRILSNHKILVAKEYHYIYYYNSDSDFAFMDRSNVNYKNIIKDRDKIKKITNHGLNKIIVRQRSKKLIYNADRTNYKRYKKVINKAIVNKYITLGAINYDLNRKSSLKYYLKAAKISLWPKKWLLLLTAKFNIDTRDFLINKDSWDFM